MIRTAALAAALSLSLGCGAAATSGRGFDLSYAPSNPSDLGAIEARVRAAPAAEIPAVAVVISPAPARGFAVFALPSGLRLGQVGATLVGRPSIAGDLVIARSPGSIVAYEFDGRERWRTSDRGLSLVGAAQDRGRVAITLGDYAVSRRNGALLVLDARTGSTSFQRAEPHAFGVPALVGRDLFVPWDGQNLSVLDAESGAELARVRSRDDTVGFAERDGGAIWFGARALYRFGQECATGSSSGAHRIAFAREGVPGSPPFMNDPYIALNAGLDARERVRLAWRPDVNGAAAGFAGGVVYSIYHRDVFALDQATGVVRWAYVHPADIAGVRAAQGGLTLVDENGHASYLDASTGRALWRAEFGAPTAQAIVQTPADFAPSGAALSDAPPTHVERLLLAAGGSDARLIPAQIFAVRALADLEGPEATHALVAVLTRRTYPQELHAAAAEAITRRSHGVDAMLDALSVHYDYARELEAPPVGALARGLAASHERRAVPALIAHLHDPATPVGDLPALVSALRELGDSAAVPALLDFLRMYHADTGMLPPVGGGEAFDDRHTGEQDSIDAALEQAALGVAAMGGAPELRALEEISAHPRASNSIRDALARLRSGAPASTPSATPSGSDMTFQSAPAHLSSEQVEAAFFPVRGRLLECLRGARSRPATVRIQFRYDNDGSVTHAMVNPAVFQACIAPIIEATRVPENTAGQVVTTYNLSTLY